VTCTVPAILMATTVTVSVGVFGQCVASTGTYTQTDMCCNNPTIAKAMSWGDPHINTIDGLVYTATVPAGTYYFLYQTNTDLIVQTTQFPCVTNFCNSAVAIKFLDLVIYVNFTAAGQANVYYSASPASYGVQVVAANPNRITYNFPTGASVGFLVLPWTGQSFYYLDVVTNLPASYKTFVYGMAGYFDGVSSNDLTGMNGVVYSLSQVNTFANTWAVPSAQNLWTNPSATFSPLFDDGSATTSAPLACYVAPPPTAKYCHPYFDSTSNGQFSQTEVGKVGWGVCATGYKGHPSKQCLTGGVWGTTLTSCVLIL